nr:EOG090X0272 [Eurycercus lamellatus]
MKFLNLFLRLDDETTLKLGGKKEDGDVFIPFSFLEKYYEVYGKMVTFKGREQFEWSHSYSRVYKPTSKYNSSGVFMYFMNYNVEVRDRVKCVSATEGVPVSTQWEASGYYYPVQVAQYGLSHYSKNLTEPPPKRRLLDDGKVLAAKWQVPKGAYVKRIFDEEKQSHVVEFNSRGRPEYLEAALKGMKPFSISSTDGGVRAYFMNQYPFYEEYPTTPPSFVLNGFIYSLIGLYDVLSLTPQDQALGDARLLFDQGMQSLKKLLPLFDTGSGSVYDLRHFTLGLPPNIARWD